VIPEGLAKDGSPPPTLVAQLGRNEEGVRLGSGKVPNFTVSAILEERTEDVIENKRGQKKSATGNQADSEGRAQTKLCISSVSEGGALGLEARKNRFG
jgi:hypothetical protein